MKRHIQLLLDSDMILYRACASAEEEVDFGDQVVLRTDLRVARQRYDDMVLAIRDRCQGITPAKITNVVHVFSGDRNFRYGVSTSYKANRRESRKPIGYRKMRAELQDRENAYVHKDMEADDALSILGWAGWYHDPNHEVVIASDDKDLNQVPGYHLSIAYADKEPWFVEAWGADFNAWTQALAGDRVDGVPGLPGVGPVKAQRMLDKCVSPRMEGFDEASAWACTLEAYGDEAKAVEAVRLTRLLRPENIVDGRIELWQPPKNTPQPSPCDSSSGPPPSPSSGIESKGTSSSRPTASSSRSALSEALKRFSP